MRLERLAGLAIALSVLYCIGLSAWSLYILPVPDSYRWYGDETWLMLSWRHLIEHGTMAVPIALGSTLHTSSGFLTGNAWLSAVFYGLPQLLFSAEVDVINIGRSVTFFFSVATVVVLGWSFYKLQVRAIDALFALLLLVTTVSFTFASHSARYDILTGLVVLGVVSFFATRIASGRELGVWNWLASGFTIVILAFAVSPHLQVLLLPMAVLLVVYFGLWRAPRKIAAYLAGGILAGLLLFLLYSITNPQLSLIGSTKFGNQFSSVISNLPIRHPFSWSAQSRQLSAKWFYLRSEAPQFAIALPLCVISEILLYAKKAGGDSRRFVFLTFLCLLFSALFLQSTLPYYLVHVLPVLTLLFALELSTWTSYVERLRSLPTMTIVALSCLVMTLSIPGFISSRETGKLITTTNIAAIQAAIEHASRGWDRNGPKPVVLAQGPAIHELLRDPSIELMSESFLFFPETAESPEQVMRKLKVDYILDYHLPMTPEYQAAIDHIAKPVFSRTGILLDRNFDYFSEDQAPQNTLTLYKVSTRVP